jgi:hypothetical protein
MRIAIPTYRRPDTLAGKTLPLLLGRGINPEQIDVFLSDPAEHDTYADHTAGTGINLIPGATGMRANRSVMMRHYPKGTEVVAIDDDLTDIIEKTGPNSSRPLEDLPNFFMDCFEAARQQRITLWGVYPVANPYFMKNRITTDLTYIVGCLYGWVTDPDAEWHHTVLDDKEDFERSIRFYEHDGGVLRIGWVAPVTKYYREPGGMQITRTEQRVTDSANWLLQHYPQYCKPNTRKTEHTEVKLIDRRHIG